MSKINQVINVFRSSSLQVQVGLGAVAFFAVFAVYTTANTLIDGYQITKETQSLKAQATFSVVNNQEQELKKLVDAPVFGEAKSEEVERVNTTLSLVGILASNDKELRRAFIAEPSEDAGVYVEGDEISKGLVVDRIEKDRVTLKRFGSPETLYIAWDDVNKANVSTPRARPTATPRLAPEKNKRPARMSTNSRKTPQERAEYLKQMREKYQNRSGIMGAMGGMESYKEFIENGGTREEYMQKVRERFNNLRQDEGGSGFNRFGRGGPREF